MARPYETNRLGHRLEDAQSPVEAVDNRLVRLHRPVCLPAAEGFLLSLSSSSLKKDKTVEPVTERDNKELRTPSLRRVHRPLISCGMVGLLHRAIAALSTPKRPRARGPGQVDVSKKRGLVPATATAARSGCHGGPSANRVANVLPAFAAGREALGTLYRLYAALEDSEGLRADEWATAGLVVDGCLRRLRRSLACRRRWERASLRHAMARVKRGRALVEDRREMV